jgi:hypothetical protein
MLIHEPLINKNCKTEASSIKQEKQYLVCNDERILINTIESSQLNKISNERTLGENKTDIQEQIIESIIKTNIQT